MHIIQSCNLGADNINLPLLRLQNVVCLATKNKSFFQDFKQLLVLWLCSQRSEKASTLHYYKTQNHRQILSCGLMLHKSGLVFVLPQGAFATTRTTVES